MPHDDNVKHSQAQPSAIDETPEVAAQNNQSSDESNFPSDSAGEGASEQKSVKRIIAADWDSLNNESSSSENFESDAPIYAKIGGTSHVIADRVDLQDTTVSVPTYP